MHFEDGSSGGNIHVHDSFRFAGSDRSRPRDLVSTAAAVIDRRRKAYRRLEWNTSALATVEVPSGDVEPENTVLYGWKAMAESAEGWLRADWSRAPWKPGEIMTAQCWPSVFQDMCVFVDQPERLFERDAGVAWGVRRNREQQAAYHISNGVCRCGLYTVDHPARFYTLPWATHVIRALIWGWMAEGDFGWRSTKAKIEEIWLYPMYTPETTMQKAEALAQTYQVPIHVGYPELEAENGHR